VTVFLLTTGCTADQAPRPGEPDSVGIGDAGGDGFELPEDASPRLRRAFERAVKAEAERDRAKAEALAAVQRHPVPSMPPVPPAGGPTLPAGGETGPTPGGETGPTPGQPDPTAGTATMPPAWAAEQPAEPMQVAPLTVPSDVREGIKRWVEAQQNAIRQCQTVQAERPTSGKTGRHVDPVCLAEGTPDAFLPWLHLMGYTEDTLQALVYEGL
jgi:hypothetical protein